MARNRIIPTKKRRKEVDLLISRYNAKINRLKKKEGITLPSKLTESTRRDILRSRTVEEYNRKLKEFNKFLKRGYEKDITFKGVKIPKAKAEIIKEYQRKLNKQTKDIIEYFENTKMTHGGVKEINLISETLETRYTNAKVKRELLLDNIDLSKMSIKEIDDYINKLRANTPGLGYKKWQNTYIGLIEDVGVTYGVNNDKIRNITDKLSTLKPEEFNKLYYTEKLIRDIMYRYQKIKDVDLSSEQEDVELLFEELNSSIDTIIKDYV